MAPAPAARLPGRLWLAAVLVPPLAGGCGPPAERPREHARYPVEVTALHHRPVERRQSLATVCRVLEPWGPYAGRADLVLDFKTGDRTAIHLPIRVRGPSWTADHVYDHGMLRVRGRGRLTRSALEGRWWVSTLEPGGAELPHSEGELRSVPGD